MANFDENLFEKGNANKLRVEERFAILMKKRRPLKSEVAHFRSSNAKDRLPRYDSENEAADLSKAFRPEKFSTSPTNKVGPASGAFFFFFVGRISSFDND